MTDQPEQEAVSVARSLEMLLFYACEAAFSAMRPDDDLPEFPTMAQLRQGHADCWAPGDPTSTCPAQPGDAAAFEHGSAVQSDLISRLDGQGAFAHGSSQEHRQEEVGKSNSRPEMCHATAEGSDQVSSESHQGLQMVEVVLEDALASILGEMVLT